MTRWGVRALDAVLRGYQRIFTGRPSPCRFTPSCSQYAREAIDGHGAMRGSWLSVRRVGRCHPWGGQGFDPVPAPPLRPHPEVDAHG